MNLSRDGDNNTFAEQGRIENRPSPRLAAIQPRTPRSDSDQSFGSDDDVGKYDFRLPHVDGDFGYWDDPRRDWPTAACMLKGLTYRTMRGKPKLSYQELTHIVNVCCMHPELATHAALGGKRFTLLGWILQSEWTDLTLVQRLVEAVTKHWTTQHRRTQAPRHYPLNQPASTDGRLPLHMACFNGKPDIVRYLASMSPKALAIADDRWRLPIHIACKGGVKDIIVYLASELPESLSAGDHNGRLPIHIACLSTNDGDVIEHLASLHPKGLAIPDKDGKLPIDHVLEQRAQRRGPPLPTIKQMLRLCPSSLVLVQQGTHSSALQRLLLRKHVDLEVLKAMVENFPLVGTALSLETPMMDTNHARELGKLFGKLQSIHLETKVWTQGAFYHFMAQLGVAPPSLRKMSLTIPAYMLSQRNSDPRDDFQHALTQNKTLSELRLDVCQDDKTNGVWGGNKHALLLESLGNALQLRETPLDRLELFNLVFPNTHGLVSLMSSDMAPKVMVLGAVDVLSDKTPSHDVSACQGQPSRLRMLTMQDMKSMCCIRLLEDVHPFLGNLKELDMECNDFDDHQCEAPHATSRKLGQVLSIVGTITTLVSLKIKGFGLDISKLVEALSTNQSLERLYLEPCLGSPRLRVCQQIVEMLGHDNATLQFMGPIEPALDAKMQAKFEYYLELNKYGRGQVRDERCDRGSFVQLLARVVEEGNAALRYGLLLERPELWCNSVANNNTNYGI